MVTNIHRTTITEIRIEINKTGCFLLKTDFQYTKTEKRKTRKSKTKKIKSVAKSYFH